MGGLNPPYEPSPRLYSPPQREGCLVPGLCIFHGDQLCTLWVPMGAIPKGQPKGQPFRGCFPSSPPQDGPPNLGIARICWGVFLVESLPILTDLYGLSWAIPSHSRVVFTVDYLFTYMFFFQKSSSGGITSSIV